MVVYNLSIPQLCFLWEIVYYINDAGYITSLLQV